MLSTRSAHTFLAVLSVGLGVAAFTTVAAVEAWQREQINSLTAEFAPDVLVVRFSDPWPEDVSFEPGQSFGLTFGEASGFGDLPGVRAVAAKSLGGRALGGSTQIQRIPVTASIFDVLGLRFQAGDGFDERAELLKLPVTVIGATVAEEMFGGAEQALGQTIDLGGMATARVDGVLAPIPSGVDEFQFLNASALVPNVPGLVASLPGQARPAGTTVFVQHEPGAADAVTQELRRALDALPVGRVHEIVSSEAWLGSQRLFRNTVADELRRGSTWVVLLALVATLGNLANTLGLRAADRIRLVAVRRAVGATRARIAAEIVADGLVIGGLGTLVGLGLWPLVNRLVNLGDGGLPVTPAAFLLAGGAGMLVTLIATAVPTIWTLRLPVMRALREQLAPPVWEGVALTGMAAGVLALVVASTIGTGAESWFRQRLTEIGADRVVLTTIGGPSDRFTSIFAPPPFTEEDVQAVAELPGVEAVATVVHDPFMVLLQGEVSGAGEKVVVARVSDSFFEINPKPIAHGRAPQNSGEVVLGPQAAEWAYPGLAPDQVIGRTVELGRESVDGLSGIKTYTIAGVFRDGNWDSPGDLYDGIIVRLATAADPPMGASSRDLHVQVDLAADYSGVIASISETVSRAHPEFGPAVVHEPAGDLRQVRETMASVGRAWNTMAWISLIVGSAGLASVVTVRLVRDRSQLALRRALGATRARVAAVSVGMALRIASYAGLVGLLLAGLATAWVASVAPWGFSWPWRESASAILIALSVALLAVSLPVFALTRASPWGVLKEE